MANLFNQAEGPRYRLDRARLLTFFNLEVGELMFVGVIWFLAPLFLIGGQMPLLPKLLTIGSFFLVGLLLFFVRVDEFNMAYWIVRMFPFWLRQRRFRAIRGRARVTPAIERIDDMLAFGGNALSFVRVLADDGVEELHVYETPLRPYRGWQVGSADPVWADPSTPLEGGTSWAQ